MCAKDEGRRWLLVTVSTANAKSSLRVHLWRKLRSLGAVYLQQSVCVLPEGPDTTRPVHRLVDRARREGGQVRVLTIAVLDRAQEQELTESFQAERADEYTEVLARVPAFFAELDHERARGRTTYAEVEESEADLHRLRTWFGRIQARDYFGAPGADEAGAAIDACADALAAFEAEALQAEAPETPGGLPTSRPSLHAVRNQAE